MKKLDSLFDNEERIVAFREEKIIYRFGDESEFECLLAP